MADGRTSPLAALPPADRPAEAGVRLAERPFLGKVSLRGDAADSAFQEAVRTVLGFYLPPTPPSVARRNDTIAFRIGPDEWLIVGPPDAEIMLVDGLKSALAARHAAVADVSSGRTVLRLSGTGAQTVLSKGCSLDLDRLAADTCVPTRLGPYAILLHALPAGAGYDLYVARSQAWSCWHWLEDAGAELGIAGRLPPGA